MKFNKYWTKEVNDQYRQMIKEGKSMIEIKDVLGYVMPHHPENKFATGKIIPLLKNMKNFNQFINEIVISPKEISYKYFFHPSSAYNYKTDYIIYFTINEHTYVLIMFYYKCKGIDSLNLLFTTEEQYKEYEQRLNDILKTKNNEPLSSEEHQELSDIVEGQTKFNELFPVMNAISYIILDFYEKILKMRLLSIKFSITETNNSKKINLYRNIIMNSFKNVKESEDVDEDGKKIFYYKIK